MGDVWKPQSAICFADEKTQSLRSPTAVVSPPQKEKKVVVHLLDIAERAHFEARSYRRTDGQLFLIFEIKQ